MWMRSFFLYLSRSKFARRILMALPGSRRVSRRFVAGETLDQAMSVAKTLNDKKMGVILDYLGESVFSEADAKRAMEAYVALLDAIAKSGVRATVSLKLTQLGLDVSEDVCMTNMRHIMKRATEIKNFVWIDMESTDYTDKTLRVFRTLREEYGHNNVGIVIQAYLFRSEADIRALIDEGATVRLCKGAYKEPANLAFPAKSDVDQNYIKLAGLYLTQEARAKGAYIGVATHDDKMIEAAKNHARQNNLAKDQFEFQMLYGIRSGAQQQLATDGYQMNVYVPYGTEWYPYYMRRLAERPANVWFILKNFVRA